MIDAVTLHSRLLDLRQQHAGGALTQTGLGRLLGVEAPTISSWERGKAVPPVERIEGYATLFGATRSLTEGRLLEREELTHAEVAARMALFEELIGLREQAVTGVAGSADPMAFADDAAVRILCGKLDEPPKSAHGHRWNYMALSAYADLDALTQLYGHVRAHNPHVKVRYTLAGRLEGRDLQSHLVILGNIAMAQTDLRHLIPRLPVHQVSDEDRAPDGEVFEIRETGERLSPSFAGDGEDRRVVEDIGLIARMPSPVDAARTLTIFSGVYTRGVFGAVRCLSDWGMGTANARWLAARFGKTTSWGVLMRVRGAEHAIATPRLSEPGAVVFDFTLPQA